MKKKGNAIIKATASAALEIGTEMIFPFIQ